jgi:ring-1,2-phenylacetyl-CoA epoxidase subunit PaaD
MVSGRLDRLTTARRLAGCVPDPELPMLSIADLGILRGLREEEGQIVISIIPTYSGCPAMETIAQDIIAALAAAGIDQVRIEHARGPAWRSDFISEAGQQALRAHGIAPPEPGRPVLCPHCGAADVEELARFGSTACKSLWRCLACREPFDRFKCH